METAKMEGINARRYRIGGVTLQVYTRSDLRKILGLTVNMFRVWQKKGFPTPFISREVSFSQNLKQGFKETRIQDLYLEEHIVLIKNWLVIIKDARKLNLPALRKKCRLDDPKYIPRVKKLEIESLKKSWVKLEGYLKEKYGLAKKLKNP